MAAGRQRVVSCLMNETTNLKAELIRLRCKSLKQNNSPRFNTTSFSLVYSREKLWSITIFYPGRKKEEEEVDKLMFLCVFFLAKRPLI